MVSGTAEGQLHTYSHARALGAVCRARGCDVAEGGARWLVGSPLPKSTRPQLAGLDSSFIIPFYSNPHLIDRFSRAIREQRQLTW